MFLSLLLPLGIFLMKITSGSPVLVDKIYSNIIYKAFSQFYSSLTGLLPFSLGEVLLILAIIIVSSILLSSLYKIIFHKKNRLSTFLKTIILIYIIISCIYFAFVVSWGLNYNRKPFSEIINLDTSPSTVSDLKNLCKELIALTNNERSKLEVDTNGVMLINNKSVIFKTAYIGYENAAKDFPVLGGHYGNPKSVIMSELMCYSGITGVYFPFTAEANVNHLTPSPLLPSTTCHEMAHQRGFAREDEANFIGYLSCKYHPDSRFKYSGYLLALINSMNAYYKYDKEGFIKIRKTYSKGVNADLNHMNEFWKKYEGPIENVSTAINDTYLKANLQEDGVHSYGRMVDLLIAEYKTKDK